MSADRIKQATARVRFTKNNVANYEPIRATFRISCFRDSTNLQHALVHTASQSRALSSITIDLFCKSKLWATSSFCFVVISVRNHSLILDKFRVGKLENVDRKKWFIFDVLEVMWHWAETLQQCALWSYHNIAKNRVKVTGQGASSTQSLHNLYLWHTY